MKTVPRNTYQLKDGDIVQTHGSRYRVGNFKMAEVDTTGTGHAARWCQGEYLGPVDDTTAEAIRAAFPRSLHNWTIQGNDRAVWFVEVSEPKLLRSGSKTFDGDPLAYDWWVVSAPATREEALALAGNPEGFYGGPGRAFADSPVVRTGRTRILITQRTGLDV